MKRHFTLLPFVALLSACGSPQTDDHNSGGITQAEADQLDRAAEKLNQDQPPPRITPGDLPKAPVPPAEQQ